MLGWVSWAAKGGTPSRLRLQRGPDVGGPEAAATGVVADFPELCGLFAVTHRDASDGLYERAGTSLGIR
jgi:hypothetical protein